MAGTLGGGMNLDGGDPRMPSAAGQGFGDNSAPSRPALQKLHDPSVTFEDYLHYAAITREDKQRHIEDAPSDSALKVSGIKGFNPFKGTRASTNATTTTEIAEKESTSTQNTSAGRQPLAISNEEYVQASRAVRTATWGAVFFLITTDILGPYSTA